SRALPGTLGLPDRSADAGGPAEDLALPRFLRTGPALSRTAAHSRPYQWRRRLGVGHQGAARLSAGLFGYERERVGGPDHRDVHSGVGTPARAVRHRRHHGRLRGQDPFGRAHRRAAGGYFLAEHAGYPGSEEIMIIDIDAHLGHYPFAQLRFNTAEKM